MKARYIGDGTDDSPRRVRYCGLAFPRGTFVDVSGLDEARVAKLAGNASFEVSDKALTKAEAASAATVADEPAVSVTGPDPAATKGDILDQLEALAQRHADKDVSWDAAASAKDLAARLEALKFELGDD